MSRLLFSTALLTLVYALVLASFQPWDLLLGAALSAGILAVFRQALFTERAAPAPNLLRSLGAFFPFVGAILWEVVVGTWAVVLVVLHLRPLTSPGIVAVPIGARSRLGVAVSALATTLSPGSYLVDVDWRRRVILLHVLDARDPDAVRAAHQRFYDRYQRHVFP